MRMPFPLLPALVLAAATSVVAAHDDNENWSLTQYASVWHGGRPLAWSAGEYPAICSTVVASAVSSALSSAGVAPAATGSSSLAVSSSASITAAASSSATLTESAAAASSSAALSGTSRASGSSSVTTSAVAVTASTLAATATLPSGVVIGTTTNLPSATAAVNKFLGIPFAQSPPLRFGKPVSPAAWSTPLLAQAWKPACIQQFQYPLLAKNFVEAVFNTPPPPAGESEDCLYLNVYAPSTPPPPGGRAVMFWIYGGSLQFGNAGMYAYDGSAFAAYQDVIVVTTNYRTNVFGFPHTDELPADGQNLGFLDQHQALEWVQQSIYAFGGDKDKVTIFGESAGAFSVDALLTAPPYIASPPFRAAILQSGTISYRGVNSTATTTPWLALASALNCSSAAGASNLACIRAANATVVQQIIDEQALTFNPTVDNVTLVYRPALQRQLGNFARVPVLAGTDAQEGRIFEFGATNASAVINAFFATTVPQIIPAVEAAYPVTNVTGYSTNYDVAARVFTDFIFTCPQSLMLNETAAQNVSTWRYFFNASFPNTQNFPNAGVFHSSEIEIVFQTYPGGPVNALQPAAIGLIPANVAPTAQEYALGNFMSSAWATFAKEPLHGPGWNALGTFAGVEVGMLGANGGAGVTMIKPEPVDEHCPLFFPAYRLFSGNAPGLT